MGKNKEVASLDLHQKNLPQTVGDLGTATGRQPVAEIFQIPWGHNREIITKCQTVNEVGANLCVRPPLGRHTGLPLPLFLPDPSADYAVSDRTIATA